MVYSKCCFYHNMCWCSCFSTFFIRWLNLERKKVFEVHPFCFLLPSSLFTFSLLWTVLWPSLVLHLQEAMFDSLSAETPVWQQNGVIGQSGGISLSLSSLRGFPLWWGGWKVRFNVLWRVAAEEKLKALHAGFWVGHSSPCSEWDVPEEFAIDWSERIGIKTLLSMEM